MDITYTVGPREKPSLVVTPHPNLKVLQEAFEERYSYKQINYIITRHLSLLETNVTAPNSTGIYTGGCQRGAGLFNSAIEKLERDMKLTELTPMYYFIFWMCDWWNYSIVVRNLNYPADNFSELKKSSKLLLKKYLTPILPKEIRQQVESMQVISAVCNPHHFAILYNDSEAMRSCILTDTKIVALDNVDGKDAYIADIAPTGRLNTANFLDKKGIHIYLKDN